MLHRSSLICSSLLLASLSFADFDLRGPREGELADGLNLAGIDMPDEEIAVSHIFAPQGFDNDDNVEVTLLVKKPSPCYGTPSANFVRMGNQIIVSSRAAKKFGTRVCLAMLVPQAVTLSLGKLEVGDFEFLAASSTQVKARMKIGLPHSENIDDHVYANVENVLFDKNNRVTSLIGQNPSDCVVLDHIETQWNGVDTLAILPIMKQVKQECANVMVPFKYDYQLPTIPAADVELLHVRSLNGEAVNHVVYNR